jgi:hypothetical protein
LVGILKILYCKEDPLSERVQEFLNVVAQWNLWIAHL